MLRSLCLFACAGLAAAQSTPYDPVADPAAVVQQGALTDTPLLFTGDTLFPGGPGNTFGNAEDFTTILRSIDERLFTPFSAATVVLPGHGAATTLGAERPHLDEWAARGW